MSENIDEVEADRKSRRKAKICGDIALGATVITGAMLVVYHLRRPPFADHYEGGFALLVSIASYTVELFAALIATKILSRSALALRIALAGIVLGALFSFVYIVWFPHKGSDVAGLAGVIYGIFIALSVTVFSAVISIVILVRSPTQWSKTATLSALIGVVAIPILFVTYEFLKPGL